VLLVPGKAAAAREDSQSELERAVHAASAFNRACQLTGLSSAELCRRLGPMIGKRNALSRQTMAAWRRGQQAVPLVAFLAACDLAGLKPPMIFALAAEELG
jgi:hypothetical protein